MFFLDGNLGWDLLEMEGEVEKWSQRKKGGKRPCELRRTEYINIAGTYFTQLRVS